MGTIRPGIGALALATLLAGGAALSAPAGARERPATLRGSGDWERPARGAAAPAQRWDIDLTRSDGGAIEGRVRLEGSRLARDGVLRGAIEGRRVSGSISDAAGNHVATFVGAQSPAGAWRGTYEDRTGEVGRWTWDGGAPRR